MTSLVVGRHYPRSAGEFGAWFATDVDCLDYLEWLRWPEGFVCEDCGHRVGWRMADGRFRCGGCDRLTSVTAGTIFDKSRSPVTVWWSACWLFATQKDGVSAQSLQRALEIGSYQTTWADAAPAARGPGPPRPRAAHRPGRGRRDVHRR